MCNGLNRFPLGLKSLCFVNYVKMQRAVLLQKSFCSGSGCFNFYHIRTITTHYETLGVQQNATAKEIKESYLRKCKEYHPDKHEGNKRMHEKFVKLNAAYQTLSDPSKKSVYDMQLKGPLHTQYSQPSSNNFYNSPFYRSSHESNFHPGSPEFYKRHYESLRQHRNQSPGSSNTPPIRPKSIVRFIIAASVFIYVSTFYVMVKRHQVYKQHNLHYIRQNLVRDS
ncbi:unnamed protein product [Clavelina lepadiformis]|uniref:J domain-containing protein n=1 Tax=Clavelina lepadiformis TaxID=159417 RepID=A0ABP0GUY0_CLALP